MLKPEVAREQIGKWKSKQHHQARLSRIKKLPKALAANGLGLFGLLPDGKPPKDWAARRKLERTSAAALTTDLKGRANLLAAIFPTFHADIEAGWQVHGQMTYTVGYARRAFRAPQRPEIYASARQEYLNGLIDELAEFPDDLLSSEWLAAWAGHLGYRSDQFGYLLAGVIDAAGPNAEIVLSILKDSAANRHEIGEPGGHATRGLLCCSRPDAWEFAENLLLAAQRQEGLRQIILEAVDEAHPQAFFRMVRVVLDQNLIRFASVARAAGVWFGEVEEVENPKKLRADLTSALELLEDSAARRKAIEKGDALEAYRGLWATAFHDVDVAIKAAVPMLKDKNPARRLAAVKLAMESGLPQVAEMLLPLLGDSEPRVAAAAVGYFVAMPTVDDDDDDDNKTTAVRPKSLFENLEKLFPSIPEKPKALKPLVPGWPEHGLGRSTVANLLVDCLDKRPAEKLLPYFSVMDDYHRVSALAKICAPKTISSKVRQLLLAVAGEPNRYVREAAIKYLRKSKIAEDEVQTLEGYLTRKTADFRRTIFELLLSRPDKPMIGTIDRLLAAGDANQRGAGIELARRMVDSERMAEPIRERLRDYRERKGKRLAAVEDQAIDIVLNPAARPPTLEDGLGLFDPADRSKVVEPKKRKVKLHTPAAIAFVRELDDWIHEHREATFIDNRNKDKPEEKVLGSIRWSWDFPGVDEKLTVEQNRERLPLLEMWEKWWKSRSAKTRDADGLEVIRAQALSLVRLREGDSLRDDDDDDDDKEKTSEAAVALQKTCDQLTAKPVGVRYDDLIEVMLNWFAVIHPADGLTAFLLDAAETALATVPEILIEQTPKRDAESAEDDDDKKSEAIEWRNIKDLNYWLEQACGRSLIDKAWTRGDHVRLWNLLRWLDEPITGTQRRRADVKQVLQAYHVGAATLADFYDNLIGPREKKRWGISFDSLSVLTVPDAAKKYPILQEHPELKQAVDIVIARVIEIEIDRGETPTQATKPAGEIREHFGIARRLKS